MSTWGTRQSMDFVLDKIAEAIGSGRLAARKAAHSPSRRAALQSMLALGVAGTAYGLYRGSRIGVADRVAFSELGLDKLPMNDLMLQRASLYDVAPVELIEYADIDLNLQINDATLKYVDKETGEDLDAMLVQLDGRGPVPLAQLDGVAEVTPCPAGQSRAIRTGATRVR